jgi:hypothetical protein
MLDGWALIDPIRSHYVPFIATDMNELTSIDTILAVLLLMGSLNPKRLEIKGFVVAAVAGVGANVRSTEGSLAILLHTCSL